MPNLICRDLSFAYDGADGSVFTHLDLIVDTDRRTALVGANGRGKTTLLRLLAGDLAPDRGAIERPLPCVLFTERRLAESETARTVAMDMAGPYRVMQAEIEHLLSQGDEPALTRYGVLETEFRALGGYEIDARLARELDALAVDERLRDRPISSLSGGEQTRCRLAGLFAAPASYPLIDEPTNHLDRSGRRLLSDYLATKPGFLLVSHDRALLDGAADHLIALNPETVEHHRLSFTQWRQMLAGRLEAQAKANVELRKDIRQLEAAAEHRRAGAQAREADKRAGGRRRLPSERGGDTGFIGARAARQMKRALAAERRAEAAAAERRETLTDVEKVYPLKLPPPPAALPRRVPLVRAVDLAVERDVPLFDPVSFEIRDGDRLAVQGWNGSGKSSLLDAIAGRGLAMSGRLEMPARVRISRVCQQPRWRAGRLRPHLETAGLDEGEFRQIMAALGVRGSVLDQRLELLSQGQLRKLELARSLSESAHLRLWDEPLNYVDVDIRERIEDLLAGTSTTLVFVEHDACFVERIATASVFLKRPKQEADND